MGVVQVVLVEYRYQVGAPAEVEEARPPFPQEGPPAGTGSRLKLGSRQKCWKGQRTLSSHTPSKAR